MLRMSNNLPVLVHLLLCVYFCGSRSSRWLRQAPLLFVARFVDATDYTGAPLKQRVAVRSSQPAESPVEGTL
jgi:hypothetical protein